MSSQLTDEVYADPERLTAEAIGQEVADRLFDQGLGVAIEAAPTFDPAQVIKALDRETDLRVGLGLINIEETANLDLVAETDGTTVRMTEDLSDAIKWRNEKPAGVSWGSTDVPDRIVLLVRGDPPKLGSMHRLSNIPLGQVRTRTTSLLCERPEFDQNAPAQTLWGALEDGLNASLSIEAVANYAVATIRSSAQASLDALGEELHRLGLFTDPNVLQSDDIEARLNENHELVGRVTRITNRDRRRLNNSVQKAADSGDRADQAAFISTVRQFRKTNDDTYLAQIKFERIKAAMETTSQTHTIRSGSSGSGGESEEDGPSGGESGGRRYERRTDDASAGLELAFEDDDEELQGLSGSFGDAFGDAIEKDERRVELTYDSDTKLIVDIDADVYYFIQQFVDKETFGGIVRGGATREEAIEQVATLDTELFQPADEDSAVATLRRFADRNPEFESVVNAFDTYLDCRSALIDALPEFIHLPMPSLLGDDDLRENTKRYLEAYRDVQQQLDNKYRSLQDASAKGARRLLSEFLLFDTIVLETERGRELVLSPLHPLHLWKYVTLASEVTTKRDQLSEEERSFLVDTIEEQPHVLNNITVGGGRILPEEAYLVQTADLASLPVYTEADRANPGTNKYLWEYLLEKFTAAYPPSRANFKLAVIDPLQPSDLLTRVSTAAQDGTLGGAEIEFVYIDTKEQDILRGATSTQEENIISVFGPDSDFDSFDLRTQTERDIGSYTDSLEETPQHCIVVNDRSSFFLEEFERDSSTSIHPLYVPKEFDYDAFEDQINICASSEGELFSEYQNLVNQLFNARQDLHQAGIRELDTDQETIATLTQGAIWTCLSTQSMNSDPFWEEHLIARERRGDRDYGIYSRDIDLFTRTLRRLLNEYPIASSEADIETIAERIVETEQSGLLRLLTEETMGQQRSRNSKGLLGAVIATQWLDEEFTEPKLLFSIDDPRTRRWLNFGESRRRADFIVAEMDDSGGLTLTIAEVKALDQPDTAFEVSEGQNEAVVRGEAVEQLLKTVETVRSLFDQADNITTPPRREALREQLYYELLSNPDLRAKSDWVDRINSVFRGEAVMEITPRIVSVELTNGGQATERIDAVTEDAQSLTIDRLPRRSVTRLLVNGRDEPVNQQATGHPSEPAPETTEPTTTPAGDHTSGDGDTPDEDSAEAAATADKGDRHAETNTDAGQIAEPDTTEGDVAEADDETATSTPAAFGDAAEYAEQTEELKRVLSDFGVRLRAIDSENVDVGPNIIRYKIELQAGEKQGKISSRAEDIAREMALEREPIVHRLSGTKFVAIDVPRPDRPVVDLEDYVPALPEPAAITTGELPFVAGVSPAGDAHLADLQDAPHMLVGGTTGSGKTVFLYSLIACILEQQSADNVRLAIIDPKLTNFMFFNGLPNLEDDQVITDGESAFDLFDWIVDEEIPRRTDVLASSGSIDIREHNERHENTLRPLVIVIDEYADLLDDLEAVDQDDEFEVNVRRIAQRARSVGIHLVISTQRPSANIINTDLRANLDMRVAFRLPADSDSRIILDESGAEELGGEGDMLFKEADDITRLQGTFIETDALRDLVDRLS